MDFDVMVFCLGLVNLLLDVVGLLVGYCTREGDGWLIGMMVVLVGVEGVVVGVDVWGGGFGIWEIDLFDLCNVVQWVHVVILIGGSVFGFAAVDGVMSELVERGFGFEVGLGGFRVFIVFAVVVFDLGCGGDVVRWFDVVFGWVAVCVVDGE